MTLLVETGNTNKKWSTWWVMRENQGGYYYILRSTSSLTNFFKERLNAKHKRCYYFVLS